MWKPQDSKAYPPRVMRQEDAAAYLAISTATFVRLVKAGAMPQPVPLLGVKGWDRLDLEAALEALKKDRGLRNESMRQIRQRYKRIINGAEQGQNPVKDRDKRRRLRFERNRAIRAYVDEHSIAEASDKFGIQASRIKQIIARAAWEKEHDSYS